MTLTHPPPRERVLGQEGPSDADLIGRSRDEPEVFSTIFDRYFGSIHRYAASRLGASVADDVAAETFLVAFAGRARYDVSRPLARAWLYGIATNLIHRHRRTEVRAYRALERSGVDAEPDGLADLVADRVTAERMQPRLAAGLARLSAGDRDVVLLVAYGELSYDEVALALGIPAGTVGSRLNRARKRLRSELGPEDPATGKERP